MKHRRPNRMRKLECERCDYRALVSRACIARGLPTCPCGGELLPTDPADLVELGLLELGDLPRRERTRLCKRMGWEDEIVRTSPSQQPGYSRAIRLRHSRELPF